MNGLVEKLYGIDGDWDELILTAHNPTSTDVFFDMFSPFVVQQSNVPNTPNGFVQPPILEGSAPTPPPPPPISPVFFITGSSQYNESILDFFVSPAWVRRIYIFTRNNNNLYQSINHIYKDANGNECQIPRIPSLSIGINQFQGWIAEIDFPNKECIFGVNQYFQNVLIEKNSEMTFLLIYKQIDKSNMLALASPLGFNKICDEFGDCPNTLRKWSEKDLILNDYIYGSPFKQNMFAGQKEQAVQPFSFELLKQYKN